MSRAIVFLIVMIVLIAVALVFLSSQASEVATQPIEVDVTNEAGR
ncbi:MAG: hypothetical protein ACR2JJ_00590 [Sphingomicrobium sp.]